MYPNIRISKMSVDQSLAETPNLSQLDIMIHQTETNSPQKRERMDSNMISPSRNKSNVIGA